MQIKMLFYVNKFARLHVSYELQQNSEQANHYVFIEQWKSKADLEQHFATPHFTSIVPVLVEYCEQAPVVQTFQKVSE